MEAALNKKQQQGDVMAQEVPKEQLYQSLSGKSKNANGMSVR